MFNELPRGKPARYLSEVRLFFRSKLRGINMKKEIKKYKEAIIVAISSILLSILVVHHWFSNSTIMYYWDSFIMLDIMRTWDYIFYAWTNSIFPGSTSLGGWSLIPYWSIFQLVHKATGSVSFAQEFLFAGLMFASLVSFYLLLSHISKTVIGDGIKHPLLKAGIYIFSMMYTFNLYTFYYGYFMLNPDVFILAFLPLNIYALLRMYPLSMVKQKVEKKFIFLFFITMLLMTSGFATYIFLAQYLIWISLYLALFLFISKTKVFSVKTISLGIFFILMILSQWWWFFSALLTFENRYDVEAQIGTTVWFDAGLIQSWLLNTTRILGVTLGLSNLFSWSHYYENPWFTLPLFTLPLLIIFLLTKFNKLKNKPLLFFLFTIFLFSLFIVKFSNPPFAFIMKFAFHNIPFFGAFRGAYHKAGMYYVFSYFILSGAGFYLLNRYLLTQKKRLQAYISIFALVIAAVVVTGPYFLFYKNNIVKLTYTFNNHDYKFMAKTKVPPEYYQLKSFFDPLCSGTATVIIPRGGWISSADWPKYNNSYVGIDFIPQIIRCEFMTTVVFDHKPEVSNQGLFFLLDHGDYAGFKNFLTQSQVGYVVVRRDHIPYSPTSWVYVNPKKVSKALDRDPDFKKLLENDLVMLYAFKPLSTLRNYGFALPADTVYTDSPLTTYQDYSILASFSPNSIGKTIINTKPGYNDYTQYVNTYISEAICESCTKVYPNNVQKTVQRKLTIHKDGPYTCRVTNFDNETKIDKLSIEDKNGNSTEVNPSSQLFLQEGTYPVSINYTLKHVFDRSHADIQPGQLIKIPLGRISQGDYRLTYKVNNKTYSVEGFLTKTNISTDTLKKRPFGREGDGVMFTDPRPTSPIETNVDRQFTANEFSNDFYTLYFNAEKVKNATVSAKITDITINKVVHDEQVTFSCGTTTSIGDSSDTKNLKVTQQTPVRYTVILPKSFKKGFLTSNKSFDYNWVAYSVADGKKHVFKHMESGYSNAWFIDTVKNKIITIEYIRQARIEKNGIITVIAFIIVFLLYLKLVNIGYPKTSKKPKKRT